MAIPARSSTILGDWYADILFTQHCQVVLCVSENARLPIVLPARELRTLDRRLRIAVGAVLRDLQVNQFAVARELAGMETLTVARTASRSILGTINDFAIAVTWASKNGDLRRGRPGELEEGLLNPSPLLKTSPTVAAGPPV